METEKSERALKEQGWNDMINFQECLILHGSGCFLLFDLVLYIYNIATFVDINIKTKINTIQGIRNGEGRVWREGRTPPTPVKVRAGMQQVVRGSGETRGRRTPLSGSNN